MDELTQAIEKLKAATKSKGLQFVPFTPEECSLLFTHIAELNDMLEDKRERCICNTYEECLQKCHSTD